jgi:hypothetical protein
MSGSVDHGCVLRRRRCQSCREALAKLRPAADRASRRRREPCPDRILDDAGAAFGMGAVGGGIWHFGKGAYNSPKGLSSRLAGGWTVRLSCRHARSPRARGGPLERPAPPPATPHRAAARRRPRALRPPGWAAASPSGAASSPPSTARWWLCGKRRARCVGCCGGGRLLTAAASQEDPWNAIASGALTGGFLQARLCHARPCASGADSLSAAPRPGIRRQVGCVRRHPAGWD